MIREIFVPLLDSPADQTALDAALALALAHEAHIAALVTVANPIPLVTEFGYLPLEVGQDQYEAARAHAENQATQARRQLARELVSSEVRLTDSLLLWSEETAALQAMHADLSLLGGALSRQDSPRFDLTFKRLLLHSGRPVLFLPEGAILPVPLRRVVMAWKPTREATRAMHDLLPLLRLTTAVEIVMIDPQVAEGRHGEEPGADIAAHLARHGLSVTVTSLPRLGLQDGPALLRHVQEVGADLLVMGGYGHARWRELVLGGATRSVLENAITPVLFSH